MLGEFGRLAHALPQALDQLQNELARAADRYELYEGYSGGDPGNPAARITEARQCLAAGVHAAQELATAISAASTATAWLGVREPEPTVTP
ncbi:hypothetical protein FJ693_05505 [Georgenia yuyongxinii]|uniref:Uncharacterized protein n=1 Tax=Georgenia yuyongxinii TaxID=2589797 RepID=A0A552WVQ6_9MICO|nr:hypothetical protein FJ693_05505 [Georgenia yuyongxinii]